MTNTRYLPAEWLDEVIPIPVDHPDHLIKVVDGKFRLVGKFHDGTDDTDFTLDVVNGEFVPFCQTRDHGNWTSTVTQDDDGNIVFDGDHAIPAEANCFVADGDNNTFAESLEDMFEQMRAAGGFDLPATFSVHAYHWSEAGEWYFAVDDDGVGHFAEPGTFGEETVH